MHLIYHAIGIVLGMVCGWLLHSNRNLRLENSSGVCDKLSDSIEGSKERITDSESKLGDIIEAGNDIEAILRKYSEPTSENKDLE